MKVPDTTRALGRRRACGILRRHTESGRYGDMATVRVKNCELMVLKPSTFMNLSGVAVRYWMNHTRLPLENLLVVVDDIALPFGAIRLRTGGADAGHNGLKNIAEQLGNQRYSRLRFGVGNDFPRGGQIDYARRAVSGRGTQTDAGTPNDCCRRHQGFLPFRAAVRK